MLLNVNFANNPKLCSKWGNEVPYWCNRTTKNIYLKYMDHAGLLNFSNHMEIWKGQNMLDCRKKTCFLLETMRDREGSSV